MIVIEIKRTIEKNQIDMKSKKKETDKSILTMLNKGKEKKIEEEVKEMYRDKQKDKRVNSIKKINQL